MVMCFQTLENRMVIDSEWTRTDPVKNSESVKISESLNGPGYKETRTGIFVPEEDAYDYATERISQDEDLKQEFVEWFYSGGSWIKED